MEDISKKYIPSKKVYQQTSKVFSNPFDRIRQMFENVPFVDIETRDILVQVPYVSQEEIQRQMAYFNKWLQRNEQILKEWEMF
jgi:hypothetical protein